MPPAHSQARVSDHVLLEFSGLFPLAMTSAANEAHEVSPRGLFALTCPCLLGPSKPDCWPFLVLVEVEDVVVYC